MEHVPWPDDETVLTSFLYNSSTANISEAARNFNASLVYDSQKYNNIIFSFNAFKVFLWKSKGF